MCSQKLDRTLIVKCQHGKFLGISQINIVNLLFRYCEAKRHLTLILALLSVLFYDSVFAQNKGHSDYTRSEKEANAIVDVVLKSSPIIDGHNDLFIKYFDCKTCPIDIKDYPLDTNAAGHTDIPRLKKGGIGAILLNVFGTEKTLDSYMQAWDLLYRLEDTYSNDLKIVRTAAEMKQGINDGKITILPSLEGASRLGNNKYLLRTYYELGLRSVTFAYNTNQLADGSDDTPKYKGISDLGKEMVKEMNRLGIIIDLSHISPKAMHDILDITTSPIIFSHSNVKSLCNVNRNVPDDVLLRLKQNRGIIMLTPVPYFTKKEHNDWLDKSDSLSTELRERFKINPADSTELDKIAIKWEQEHPIPVVTIADFANHFDYVKKIIGVDYIGIAGDYDGINFTIKDMEDVSTYPKLLLELAMRGWTESELKKITSENFLRVFEQVEN